MKFAELLRVLRVSSDVRMPDIPDFTEKTAEITSGCAFVCIKGVRADGHEFASEAYRKGCRIFVAERALALPSDAVVLTVPDTRAAFADLACAFYGHPSREMRLVAITGTKGKTTTALLAAHILNQNGVPCGYIGTNGISFGNVTRPTANTTPDAKTFQKALREMVSANVRTAVIEVSSQALMQSRVRGTQFEIGIFTNLSPDHIGPGEHADYADYRACKRKLFTDYAVQVAVCNTDDPESAGMVAGIPAVRCGQNPDAEFRAADILCARDTDGAPLIRFSLLHDAQKIDCRLPMIGKCNVMNALLATAAANRFGISPERCRDALANAHVSGRSEIVNLGNGASAVIDYAHNKASMTELLSAIAEYCPARLICLFGSVGERSQMRRRELGEVAAQYADFCILTSDNPGREDPDAIIREIGDAVDAGKKPWIGIPERAEAIRYAVSLLRAGDILVLAGKGHETYQLIGDSKIPFCEKNILTECAVLS